MTKRVDGAAAPSVGQDRGRERWCEWCGSPFRPAGTGRMPRYCRRSCRQRAYEHRQEAARLLAATQEAERAALAYAAGLAVPSRDETPQPGPALPPPRSAAPLSAGEELPLF
ncbi:predicted protein [Streptomyces sp. SPB78]|nr:predicted protein [Streptomyces sp. SPB78]EFL04305.1 predicted protein [Streptomyces sp. SPB78]